MRASEPRSVLIVSDAGRASGAFSATSALAPLGNVTPATRSADVGRTNFGIVAAGLPQLPKSTTRPPPADPMTNKSVSRPSDPADSILLVSMRDTGRLELLLGGSVSLGAIELSQGAVVLAADLLDRDMSVSPPPPLRVGVLYRLDATVQHAVYALDDFPTPALERIVGCATSIARLVDHAFVAMEEAKRVWAEAQKAWAAWLDKVAPESVEGARERYVEGSKILVRFLATGRATPHLREYLTSKLTERVRLPRSCCS